MLWIKAVLGPICRRLSDGQSLEELSQHIESLLKDVECYYRDLVFSRIHSTYRTDGMSECAMALRICLICESDTDRYLAMWMLQHSIATSSGVAYDPDFANHFPVPDCNNLGDEEASLAVNNFVSSRCQDLLVMGPRAQIAYQHRVVYDFLKSGGMRVEIESQLPRHFHEPHFELQLATVSLKLSFECYTRGTLVLAYFITSTVRFENKLSGYLNCVEGLPNGSVLRVIDQLACEIFKSFAGWLRCGPIAGIMMSLVRAKQNQFVSNIVARPEPQQTLPHLKPIYLQDSSSLDKMLDRNREGLRNCHVRIPCHLSTSSPSNEKPYYVPCYDSIWTNFLDGLQRLPNKEADCDLLQKRCASSYIIKEFIKAGANIEFEICLGDRDCYGPFCVCSDPRTHAGLFECPKIKPQFQHKHTWISAREIILRSGLQEVELEEILATRREHKENTEDEHIQLAIKTDAILREFVEDCVQNNRSIEDPTQEKV
jgi:hypothetical protein